MSRTIEEKLAAGQPEPWIPEKPGESLIGEIESVETMTTDYGPAIVTTILKSDGKAVSFAWFGNVLKNAWERKRPVPGMTLGIQFLGTVESKTKGYKPYKNFQVELDESTRPAGAVSYTPPPASSHGPSGDDGGDYGDEPF